MTDIIKIQEDVKHQLAEPAVLNALVATTFKGLKPEIIPQAITEGVMRGFNFKDFLEKNVYAIPYGTGYNLVTSIDYARKIGAKSGVVGKSAPKYETDDKGNIVSCTITIKKQVGASVGEFTETVYFNEYSTGKNLWTAKPRTMIAKVAEMHALRMACPEELSQVYGEEELEKEEKPKAAEINLVYYGEKLKATTSIDELKIAWASLPAEAKAAHEELKNQLKEKHAHANA